MCVVHRQVTLYVYVISGQVQIPFVWQKLHWVCVIGCAYGHLRAHVLMHRTRENSYNALHLKKKITARVFQMKCLCMKVFPF